MADFWSLIFFTLFAQAGVGLILFTAVSRLDPAAITKRVFAAVCLLVLAALTSLTHLSAPFISFYAISNPGSSWLSREILALILTGAAALGWLVLKKSSLGLISTILGLILVFVMSSVYQISNQPSWNSVLTPGLFFGATLTLGGALSFCLDAISPGRGAASDKKAPAALPLFLLGAGLSAGCAMAYGLPGVAKGQAVAHVILLIVGAALAAALSSKRLESEKKDGKTSNVSYGSAALILALISIAELCGRITFYAGYASFGG